MGEWQKFDLMKRKTTSIEWVLVVPTRSFFRWSDCLLSSHSLYRIVALKFFSMPSILFCILARRLLDSKFQKSRIYSTTSTAADLGNEISNLRSLSHCRICWSIWQWIKAHDMMIDRTNRHIPSWPLRNRGQSPYRATRIVSQWRGQRVVDLTAFMIKNRLK